MQASPLRYWFWWPPKTFDTYKADLADVMQVAKNIYAPLVSTFMDGKPQGMVAESWDVDAAGRKWRFKIRKGLAFDDGASITPEVVLQNFRRMLWLTRADGLALNALLPEVLDWKDYDAPLKSLYVQGDSVVFEFSKRPTNLFEAISQPIYGIASPKCFDGQGNWKEPFCALASGQYKVARMSPGTIVLESRHVFPEADHAPEVVEIHTPAKADGNALKALLEGQGELSIEPRFSLSRETVEELRSRGLRLVEEPPLRMYFMQLNAARPPFGDKALRQSVRDRFLHALSKDAAFASETQVNPSFIPKGGIGYLPFEIPEKRRIKKVRGEEVAVLFYPLARYPFPRDRKIQNTIENAVVESLKLHGLTPRVTRYEDRAEAIRRLKAGDFDVMLRMTGILINDPYADLRMMFMSKIGALIPDPSGKIPALIEKADATEDPAEKKKIVESINSSIYDEAAVVTYAHSGLAYIHSPGVDLSRFNLFADPIEFRAVDWTRSHRSN